MKKLEAIIRPFKLDRVKEALHEVGISGMTVTEVGGVGLAERRAAPEADPGGSDLVPQIKIKVVLDDALAGPAVEAVQQAALNGNSGTGKIVVVPIDAAVRIRTGENGPEAV